MKNSEYNKKVDNFIKIIKESLDKKDFETYNHAVELFEDTVSVALKQQEMENEYKGNNFGVLNHIFESVLPDLFKKDRKLVGRVMRTIKEDKNLLSQFQFYNALRGYNGVTDSTSFVRTALNLTEGKLDKKSIKESNAKLAKILKDNEIYPSDKLSNEKRQFFESCNTLLTKRENLSNINKLSDSLMTVSNYINEHRATASYKIDLDEMFSNFNNTFKDKLNEDERSLVMDITNIRNKDADTKREKLLNKFKNESLTEIGKLLSVTEDSEEIDNLKGLEEQIQGMQYSSETIVRDLAKLIEICDVLKDKD